MRGLNGKIFLSLFFFFHLQVSKNEMIWKNQKVVVRTGCLTDRDA